MIPSIDEKNKFIHDMNSHLSSLSQGLNLLLEGEYCVEEKNKILNLLKSKQTDANKTWIQIKELLAKS